MWAVEVSYEPTTPEDVDELMLTLRREDRLELEIGTGIDAKDVIEQSIENSHDSNTLRANGELLAIIGLGSTDMWNDVETGVPWLVGSTAIDRHKKTFQIVTKSIVQFMLREYKHLRNYTLAENKKSIEWLETLGFTMHKPEPFGAFNAEFVRFTMERGEPCAGK